MRKIVIIAAVFFAVLGIILAILPFWKIALLSVGITFILSFLAIKKSETPQTKLPKIILFISALTFLVVIGKVIFIKMP